AWLHLAGFDLPLDQVKKFRQLGSMTPGHPEFGETPGVESTTGPLGQGVGNAVGFAISGMMSAARFNTAEHRIFDHKVVCLAGDGCLQEGVASEACALAGHLQLDNLILIYDANDVTLDAMALYTQSEDTGARFKSYGWGVQMVDGQNMEQFFSAYETARQASGKPQLIIAKTLIGKGIPEVAGTSKAHGESGAGFAESARKGLGLPEERFSVSPEVTDFFVRHAEELRAARAEWQENYEAWKKANLDLASELDDAIAKKAPNLLDCIPDYPADGADVATRKAASDVLQHVAKAMPLVISGSADLHGSTLNYIKDGGDFDARNHTGRNIRFGIREHGMAAILNGLAYDGIIHASGATFLVFSDYARPSIRVAALSHLPVVYIFTHDSVGVGEDGPTHQPVEAVAALRAIPNLDVIRPADPAETAGAFAAAFERKDGPTLLALSRQVVPTLRQIPEDTARQGVLRGAYVARHETGALELLLLATGSELHLALEAADKIGPGVRVVSMPCFERFDRQPPAYRDQVLPPGCDRRISIEAGVSQPWYKYVGRTGRVIGIDRFGLSAPGGSVLQALGISVETIVQTAGELSAAS
ncbi:MAG: transketolase, partial [Chthoniobacterales bacterium]|nr:transketolase [Chthoniobacterales bacterium]